MIPLPPREKRKPVESDIQTEIRIVVNRLPDVRVTRNNVGTIRDARGIPVSFGLSEGSPDLVGIITFGKGRDAIALAFGLEVKQPGRYTSRKQKAWHEVARRRGLETDVVHSAAEAIAAMARIRAEYTRRLRQCHLEAVT